MVQIFYFSGTGNSLSVARCLSHEIERSEVIPMIKWLNAANHPELEKKIILAFPTYLMCIPLPVREFLSQMDFRPVEYIAAIFTAENKGNLCHITINRILREHEKNLDYYSELQMPQNTPTGIKPTKGDSNWTKKITPEITEKLMLQNQQRCKAIASDIQKSEKSVIHVNWRKQLFEKLLSAMTMNNKALLPFYADETCTGCKVCAKVCPTRRITALENKITWNRDKKCYYCFACFNACPKQAILLKNYTKKEGRYINPEITLSDLIGQSGE